MRICIQRGAREIGGSCIELEQEGQRLVLDIGLPLDDRLGEGGELPPVDGLATGDASLLGVVISHGHPDHYGLAPLVHASVPLYMGEATQRILREAPFFTPGGADLPAADYLVDRRPLRIGPFTVTPYLVDHSAFDAYALLVEAGGCRVFYSGDLRAHGRKRRLFERLLASPPHDVDVLLLEGTNVRDEPTDPAVSERDVEERCVRVFRDTPGMVLANYSAQNIDRLVTLYRAAKRSRRLMVLDLYTATIARATGRLESIPQAEWDGVRVYVPLAQRIKVKQSEEFERTDWVRRQRIFGEELAARSNELVMTFRGSMREELERVGCLDGARAVWSMWRGYLDQPTGQQLKGWLGDRGIPLEVLHSSGHASVADLQRLAAAIDAGQVVPVHTRHPALYPALHQNVCLRDDGHWWEAAERARHGRDQVG